MRDSYQIFKYQELEQRLHSATLQARELTAPSVYFRFLSDRDKSVRDMTAWLETRFPASIDLPQEHITTTLAKYLVTTGMPINNTLTHITFHQHQQFRMWQLHLQNMPRNTTTSLSQAGNAYYHWAHATSESGWAEQEEVDTHGIAHRPRDRRCCIHSTLAHISSIWILEPDPNFSTPVQHMLAHEDEFGEPQLLPTDVQMRDCWYASFTSVYITIWYANLSNLLIFKNLHLPINIMRPCDIDNIHFEIFLVTRGIEHISGTNKKSRCTVYFHQAVWNCFEESCQHVVTHCNSKRHMCSHCWCYQILFA